MKKSNTDNNIIRYIVGGVLSTTGFIFYLIGTVQSSVAYLQPGYWLFGTGMTLLGLSIDLSQSKK